MAGPNTAQEGIAPPLSLVRGELLRSEGLIAGQWTGADSGQRFVIEDPATRSVIAELPRMGEPETLRAIESASQALSSWGQQTAKARADILRRWSELMIEHQEDLATLMTAEQGKPLAEARNEIEYAASFFEWFGEQGKRTYGQEIPSSTNDRRLFVTHDPAGVGAGITPWNFPAAMIARKAGAALAAGCPIVLKPAEQAPLSALALAFLGIEAGVPTGVVNVITGNEEDAPVIGRTITGSKAVKAISFTGSTAVGKLLMRDCSQTVKRVSLELGGNAPMIVFDDANVANAIKGSVESAFRNAGQTCVSARRLIVHEDIFDSFKSGFVDAVEALQVGPGNEPDSDLGPLIDDDALAKVVRHVEGAVAEGAKVLTGGEPHPSGGRFWQPTVLTEVTTGMEVVREETFGPVVTLESFSTEEQAVRSANQFDSGLAAYVYTENSSLQWRLASSIESGVLGINTGVVATASAPFGGVKESGLGREGSHEGIDEWLETKYICLAGIQQ